MDFSHQRMPNINTPEAYEAVFQAILSGDQTIFTSWDSIERSWEYTDHLLELSSQQELSYYEARTNGPKQADELLEKDQRSWINVH